MNQANGKHQTRGRARGFIWAALALFLCWGALGALPARAADPLAGDVSGDGTVSGFDAGMLREHLLGRVMLNSSGLAAADANGDGALDAADLLAILQRSVSPGGFVFEPAGNTIVIDGFTITAPPAFVLAPTAVEIDYAVASGQGSISESQPPSLEIRFDPAGLNKTRRDSSGKLLGLSGLKVGVKNIWNTTTGAFYGAVEYTTKTGRRAGNLLESTAVTLASLELQFTNEVILQPLDCVVLDIGGKIALKVTGFFNGEDPVPPPDSVLLRKWESTLAGIGPQPIGDAAPGKTVIVFIHGVLSNHDAWKQVVSGLTGDGLGLGQFNPADPALPATMTEDWSIWVADYDYHHSVEKNGVALDDLIQRVDEAHPGRIENLILVGHSMGTIVMRRAVQSALALQHGWAQRVRGQIFAGGLHEGTPLLAVGQAITGFLAFAGDLSEGGCRVTTPLAFRSVCSVFGVPESKARDFVYSPGFLEMGEDMNLAPGEGRAPNAKIYLISSEQSFPADDCVLNQLNNFWHEPNDGWVPVRSAHDTADFGTIPASRKKHYTQVTPAAGMGGHIQLYPTIFEYGEDTRTLATIRADLRYQALRDFIADAYVPPIVPGQEATFTLPGGVPLTVVKIPRGSFLMGSGDAAGTGWPDSDEFPQHQVTIGYDFYMGKFEVTQAQWLAVMGSWPSSSVPNASYGAGDNFPAYYVSWNDIQNFEAAINALGLGGTFRLPSEAEWEYAARGGTQTRFPFGDSTCASSGCVDCDLSQYAWWCGNNTGSSGQSGYGSKLVGGKLPNAFGLYDTMGNVYEWCEDWWHGNYTGAPTDGSAWVLLVESFRVIRGGYWGSNARICRPASRNGNAPVNRLNALGFRLAWTP